MPDWDNDDDDEGFDNASNPRWRATIVYRGENGPIDVTHDMREISELHDIVEFGPHWDTIMKIEIVRAVSATICDLTLEEAEKL